MIHEGIQDVESVAMELSTASVNGTGRVLHIILQELCKEQNSAQWKTSQYIRC